MLLRSTAAPSPSAAVPVTVHLPYPLWEALQICTPDGRDVAAVICEAVGAPRPHGGPEPDEGQDRAPRGPPESTHHRPRSPRPGGTSPDRPGDLARL